jgi:hypothetical protein
LRIEDWKGKEKVKWEKGKWKKEVGVVEMGEPVVKRDHGRESMPCRRNGIRILVLIC